MYKVILVDDETRVRESICALLDWEGLGLRLLGSCENALDALQLITDERPDILLTDIRMPVMDGLELIGQAKQMAPELVCAVLSGYDDFPLVQSALRQGVTDYLLKPCRKEDLERALSRCAEEVERAKSGMIYRHGQRKRAVARLCAELMELQPDRGGRFTGEQVRGAFAPYRDLSLLSEAATLLMARHEALLSGRTPLWSIARVIEDDQPYERVAELLGEIYRAAEQNESVVDQAVRFADEHYDQPGLTLQYVAEQVIHVNAQHLGKRFLRQEGMKFGEYLLKVRMERAMALLRGAGDNRVYEIAGQIGLGNNVQYFYQVFKRYTGKTPREYQLEAGAGETIERRLF